jgi:methyl-accepting chemotaxis protein
MIDTKKRKTLFLCAIKTAFEHIRYAEKHYKVVNELINFRKNAMKELEELKKQLESIDEHFGGRLTLKEYYESQDLAKSLSRLIKKDSFLKSIARNVVVSFNLTNLAKSSIKSFIEHNEQMIKAKAVSDKCNPANIDELTKSAKELSDSGIAASQAGEELKKIFINTVSSFGASIDKSKRIANILAKKQKLKNKVRKILGYSKDEFEKIKVVSCGELRGIWVDNLNYYSDYHYLNKKELKKVKKYFDL